ncbi:MAG: hypothetical protein R2741_05445 [Methanolobus sp.]
MVDIITTSPQEQDVCCKQITEVDGWPMSLRDTIRRHCWGCCMKLVVLAGTPGSENICSFAYYQSSSKT